MAKSEVELKLDDDASGSFRIRRAFAGKGADAAWAPPSGEQVEGGGAVSEIKEMFNWEAMSWTSEVPGATFNRRAANGMWMPFYYKYPENKNLFNQPDTFTENTTLGLQAWLRFPNDSYTMVRTYQMVTYTDANGKENTVSAITEMPFADKSWHRVAGTVVVPSGRTITALSLRLEDISSGEAVRIPSGVTIDCAGMSFFIGGYAPVVLVSAKE